MREPTRRLSPPVYEAPRWLPGGHAQTIYASRLRGAPLGVRLRGVVWG